jgi:hypothetical protein
MSTSIISLSVQQLRRAADLKEKLQSLETELGQILGASTKPDIQDAPKKRRKLSPAVRAKMAAAAKKRWAKVKGAKPEVSPKPKKQGGMSAAGRARIVAAQKARWAKIKASKPTIKLSASPAPKKKFKMSAAAKAKISAAAKARWAKAKAAGKTRL